MKQLHSLAKIALLSTGFLVITVDSKAQHKDSIAVKAAVDRFVQAFNTLDWEPFRNAFADDATIFFPEWEWAYRRSGKEQFEKTWLEIFPEFIDANDTLTLNIDPKNVMIQIYNKTAIVSFHLGSGEKYLARRTLVLVKKRKKWKIAHLHASYVFA